MTPYNLCVNCVRVQWDDSDNMTVMKAHCSAFPKGIPQAILTNRQDHRKPIKGDNGIQFLNGSDLTDKEIDSMFKIFE